MSSVKVHLRIYGYIQGVFFRQSAKKEAERLGITGWIRNNLDGSVESVAVGPKEKLEEFITWCKKGPPAAKVENVEVDWSNQQEDFEEFEIA